MRTPFQWNTANFAWDSNPFGAQQSTNPFTWDDVALVTELAQAIGGGHMHPPYQQIFRDEKKKERFIKLLCKVKGKKYKKTKKIKDIKIVISDVELVVQEVSRIVKIEL